jgi:hypothetical protein
VPYSETNVRHLPRSTTLLVVDRGEPVQRVWIGVHGVLLLAVSAARVAEVVAPSVRA